MSRSHIVGCDGQHDEGAGCLLTVEPADPPADPRWPSDPTPGWLEAWAAGWLAGYASGYEAGTDNGYAEYGADLAHAVSPLKRAAARGIDMMLARRAWENQRRAEHGMPPLTGPLERGGDREPYPRGGDQDA